MRTISTDSDLVFLSPGEYVDSDHPAIRTAAARLAPSGATPAQAAGAFYVAVRDIYYDYVDHSDLEVYRASSVLAAGRGYCVGKASLYAALCRARGIAARVAFADVKNHLATPRLLERIGTDLFAWHGFTEVLLDGRWVKASPTFNASLCAKLGVKPLEFDGVSDAILQPFDAAGRTFMRYVKFHGAFHDVPARFLKDEMARLYPRLGGLTGDMQQEAAEAHA
jgi:transglutaminase-like putative cysteine protease